MKIPCLYNKSRSTNFTTPEQSKPPHPNTITNMARPKRFWLLYNLMSNQIIRDRPTIVYTYLYNLYLNIMLNQYCKKYKYTKE